MMTRQVEFEPTYPNEFDRLPPLSSARGTRPIVTDVCVEDVKNSRIPVGVEIRAGVVGEKHHVRMCPRIERILVAAHVVSGIVDTEDFVSINTVVEDVKATVLLKCVSAVGRGS